MTKIFKTILVAVLILTIFTVVGAQGKAISLADSIETFEKGCRATQGSIKIVNLSGTWREMGRQYGYLMKSELSEVYTLVQSIIEYNIGNASIANKIVAVQTIQTPYRS